MYVAGVAEEFKETNNHSTQTYESRFSLTHEQGMSATRLETDKAGMGQAGGNGCRDAPPRKDPHRVRFPPPELLACKGPNGPTYLREHPNACCLHADSDKHKFTITSRV